VGRPHELVERRVDAAPDDEVARVLAPSFVAVLRPLGVECDGDLSDAESLLKREEALRDREAPPSSAGSAAAPLPTATARRSR